MDRQTDRYLERLIDVRMDDWMKRRIINTSITFNIISYSWKKYCDINTHNKDNNNNIIHLQIMMMIFICANFSKISTSLQTWPLSSTFMRVGAGENRSRSPSVWARAWTYDLYANQYIFYSQPPSPRYKFVLYFRQFASCLKSFSLGC